MGDYREVTAQWPHTLEDQASAALREEYYSGGTTKRFSLAAAKKPEPQPPCGESEAALFGDIEHQPVPEHRHEGSKGSDVIAPGYEQRIALLLPQEAMQFLPLPVHTSPDRSFQLGRRYHLEPIASREPSISRAAPPNNHPGNPVRQRVGRGEYFHKMRDTTTRPDVRGVDPYTDRCSAHDRLVAVAKAIASTNPSIICCGCLLLE